MGLTFSFRVLHRICALYAEGVTSFDPTAVLSEQLEFAFRRQLE
jgi:hypothetical protein